MFDLVAFIPRAIVQGMPLLFGCTGETISEKAGSLNLGIPGVMYVGGICGVIGSFIYEQSCSGDLNPFGATDQTGVTCSPLSIMTSDLARPDEVIEELPFVADGHLSLILRTNSKQSGGYRSAAIFKAPPSTGGNDPTNPDIKYDSPLGDAEGFLCLMALLLMIKSRKRAKVGETEHLSDDTTILKTL